MTHANQFRILACIGTLACSLLCSAAEDAWIEVRSPHFIVLSDATVAQARQVARTLEQFRSVFQAALPKLRVDPGSPLVIFAVRDARSLRALAPNDHQQDEFLRLIQNGVPEQEAAERALGDLKALQKNLERYIRSHLFYSSTVPAQLSVTEDPYPARTLSPAESAASRGELLVHANRPVEAKALLEQALQLDPRSADANEGMGLLFLRLGNQAEAQKRFSEAAKLDSKSFIAQYYAAESAYEQDKDYRAAEIFLRKALGINPHFAPAYRMLSMTLMMQGVKMMREARLPEALELAEKAVELEPAELSYRINVGRILVEMGRNDEAYRLGERILALARTEAERRQGESLLFMIKERQDEMLEAQRRAEALREEAKQLEERRGADGKLEEQRRMEAAARKQAGTQAPKIKTGPAGRAEGLVRSVQCNAPAILDVVLDSNGRQRRLRAEDYRQVRYRAAGTREKAGFKPCEELKGKRVQIEFLSVSGQKYSGLIKTVAVEK